MTRSRSQAWARARKSAARALAAGGCGDCHDIWIDRNNPAHWVVTGDAGAGYTRNHGQSYTTLTLPIGQMYHVAVDQRVPYWIYSNRQDDGTMRGPSNSPVPVTNVPTPALRSMIASRSDTPGSRRPRSGTRCSRSRRSASAWDLSAKAMIDIAKTYTNIIASTYLDGGCIPMIMNTDRDAIALAVKEGVPVEESVAAILWAT